MRIIQTHDKEFLDKNGFLVLHNIFSEDEILSLKEKCHFFCGLSNYTESPAGDVMSLEGIGEVMLDKRFAQISKDILGEKVVYFGDGSLHCKPNRRVFHKDSRDDLEDPGSSSYPLYRIGVFLQEHVNYSGGIKFRSGSHKKVRFKRQYFKRFIKGKVNIRSFFNFGKIVNTKPRIGDVVIWNLRTDHSGGAVHLKFFPSLGLMPWMDALIPDSMKLPEHDHRMAMFCCFAAPSKPTTKYMMNKIENPKYKNFWTNCQFDRKAIQDKAKQSEIILDFSGIKSIRNIEVIS